MYRLLKKHLAVCLLYYLPRIHHCNTVGHIGNNTQIMRNKQNAHVTLLLQFL